jgi:hypothetical protein
MKRSLTTFTTVLAMAAATAVAALFVPGIALGTLTEVGQAPGDVITYAGATGASGTTGATGTSGTSGASGTTGSTGSTDTSPIPQCPGSPCVALTQTTGFQVKVGSDRSLTTIQRSGSILAWTVTLGSPTTTAPPGMESQTTFFDRAEGGAPAAGIAILKPGPHLEYTLVAQSPTVALLPYLGETVQFPLAASIPVTKGEVLALSVPTWAPVLALADAQGTKYGKFTSWRSSRQRANKGCTVTSTQTAQQSLHSVVQYGCLYQGVRVTYSALLVSTP